MTKFQKLSETINNLGDMKTTTDNHNRSKLLIELGQIRTDLGFLQPDIRYKWERKEVMDKIDDLMELISKKRFF